MSDDRIGATSSRQTLPALFWRFLRFGMLAWGGPVAQIAMIKRELVDEEKWISPSKFNRLLAVYQILPGPEAHELCVHFGMLKGKRLGGFVAGLGFMLPGLVLVLGLAWLYQRLDFDQPIVAALLTGLQIGVIALIVRALHRIAGHALGNGVLWTMAIASAALTWQGLSFWILLPLAGLIAATVKDWRIAALLAVSAIVLVAMMPVSPFAGFSSSAHESPTQAPASASLLALFLSGLKAGLLTFGGAYTAIPFIRDDVVGRGWLSESQFLDSIALSSIIPAPLVIFATFVGFVAAGLGGALAMTAGMFLPAFAFTLLFYDQLERVIEDSRLHGFLEGVAAGVVGLIAVTAFELAWALARSIPALLPAILIFAAALGCLIYSRSRIAVPAVVVGTALAGVVAFT
ncbi:chromate efflux transporter [Sphingomonas jaspsi]|uniref:chromate efflux transporter n=1 Tax=Sphingomonas jaspsi TaxID=392409 RepID=UPI0004B72F08|nr:chromate efflux transporter [Sphingomonas jaspsi]